MNKRRLTSQGTIDPSSIDAIEHDLTAAGHGDFAVEGKLQILGSLSTAVCVPLGSIVRVFNNGVALHYVKIGDSTVTAPTTPANGIPVPIGQYVTVNTADNQYIRSDNASVYGYLLVRDSQFEIIPDANS